jgi:hypothetical protein
MRDRYPLEKFAEAVDYMATSDKSLRERIFGACMTFRHLQPTQMPDRKSAQMYKKLRTDITRFPAVGSEGTIQATIGRLTEDELRDVSQQIVDLRAYLEDVLSD